MTPFFRLPAADVTGCSQPYLGAGAVLLGVPYDGGATYKAGARLAPYHVRRVSALWQGFHATHGIDVFSTLHAVDGGNAAFPPFDARVVREIVEAEVGRILAADAVPFILGGDHSVSLPCLRAAARHHGALSVVHVDAHYDTSNEVVWGEAFHHGTPLRHAVLEGLVEPGQLYQVGIRASTADAEEASFSRAHGARVFTMEELVDRGLQAVAAEVRRGVGRRKVYVTFDVDGIDPAFAPGTGTPVPGGLSSREAIRFLRELAGIDLAGMDVVEVAPDLDHADMTSYVAAALLFEGMALAAVRVA